MKKFPDILRPILSLLVVAAYLAVSTGSLVHEVLHAGAARGDVRSGHDHRTNLAADDGTSLHDTTTTCPLCLAGPLAPLMAAAPFLILIRRTAPPQGGRLPEGVVRQSFLTPSFRAPPLTV